MEGTPWFVRECQYQPGLVRQSALRHTRLDRGSCLGPNCPRTGEDGRTRSNPSTSRAPRSALELTPTDIDVPGGDMPLTRFDPPAGIDDLDSEPLRKAWSDQISSMVNSNKASLQASLGANAPQFFNELTDPKNMADRAEQDIIWQGFPRLLEKQYGENTSAAFKHAEDDTPGATARKATQDEYLEWHVTRDNSPTKKIVRVEFTCEGPEYWQFLANKAPDKALALYQKHVSAAVVKADLFTAAGVYKPLNKWNTGSGAMHLIQRNNTLEAEVNIGAFATIKRKHADGSPITDADELIHCAQFGVSGRASDPHIGDIVNGLARQGYSITIKNPIGLYIHKIDLTGFKKPDGAPITPAYFKIPRGSAGQGLRAVFEVPPGETSGGHPFTVSDITIGGVKIAFGGQIAKRISIKLTGVAVEKGKIDNPMFACAGATLLAARSAGAIPMYTRTSAPAPPEE